MATAGEADEVRIGGAGSGGSRRAFLGGGIGAGLLGVAAGGYAIGDARHQGHADPVPAVVTDAVTGRLPAVPFSRQVPGRDLARFIARHCGGLV